ncbi:MAG: lamin tail domain-containing protein [Flavobacteriales bacterium]|nr:MAG: lamin tail domain-containing protein [Flavobacteriales bacterium]
MPVIPFRFRLLVALLPALVPAALPAQVNDDFEDGDFTAAPAWAGDAALFTVADVSGDRMLRSNSTGAATYALSTPSTLAADARWEWFMDLRFATSGANYADVYIISDEAVLTAAQNGWFVRIGGTADRVELFKRVGGANASVLASPDGIVNSSSSNPLRIRVERTAANDWILAYDDGNTGSFASVGPVNDGAVASSIAFGVLVVQSSAAGPVNNHFFDDFAVGGIPVDLAAPEVVTVQAVSASAVDVLFNEPLDPVTAGDAAHYAIAPPIAIAAAQLDGANAALVHLTLTDPLAANVQHALTVTGVEDLAGNPIAATGPFPFTWVVPDAPLYRDVVINEIMADPTPAVGLPEAEFVELFNATADKTFDLAGWKLSDGSSSATLPSYALGPGGHVLITSNANSALFATVANRIGVASLPSLNNDADNLALAAPGDVLIDAVEYSLGWYQDAVKQEGGWTLEQVNPFTPCSGASNWTGSNAPVGGTPGEANSVLDPTPDAMPPSIVAVLVVDSVTVELIFSEAMDAASLVAASYAISPGIAVTTAAIVPGTVDRVRLTLSAPIVVGVLYTVTVSGATDCPGNAIGAGNAAAFSRPEPVVAGDIVINEVLYDPFATGSDFVEIYNRSAKTLSLQGMQLANETNGAIANLRTITPDALLLMPNEYILLATSTADIAARYPQGRTDRFLQMSLPSYNNGSGTVVLLDAANAVIDLFRYDDDLHFGLVNKPEGYSLERVDPDRGTDDPTNWHTASDVSGGATPGFRNSQYSEAPEASGELTIEPGIFSPDQDGFQDLLTIAYRFDRPGFVGTIIVYDIAGRETRRLMDSQLLGTEGALSWDGLMEGGSKARMGPYVVVLEAFDLDGNVETYRKTVTLAHPLD